MFCAKTTTLCCCNSTQISTAVFTLGLLLDTQAFTKWSLKTNPNKHVMPVSSRCEKTVHVSSRETIRSASWWLHERANKTFWQTDRCVWVWSVAIRILWPVIKFWEPSRFWNKKISYRSRLSKLVLLVALLLLCNADCSWVLIAKWTIIKWDTPSCTWWARKRHFYICNLKITLSLIPAPNSDKETSPTVCSLREYLQGNKMASVCLLWSSTKNNI